MTNEIKLNKDEQSINDISADPLAKLEGEATGKDKTNANSFDLLFSFH